MTSDPATERPLENVRGGQGHGYHEPIVQVAGSGPHQHWLAMVAQRAGFRLLSAGDPTAEPWPTSGPAPDLLLLDLRGGDGAAWLERWRRTAGVPVSQKLCAIVDLPLLDEALFTLDGPGAEFLCEPTDGEIVAALVATGLRPFASPSSSMGDASRDQEALRLEKLSEEVRRLALTIERLSGREGLSAASGDSGLRDRRRGFHAQPDHGAEIAAPVLARQSTAKVEAPATGFTHADIKALIRARRLRDSFLPADLFADPAWDMLLDLLAARLAGQRVSVSSLCIAAAVPPTTALRWIRQLTERQILLRIADPTDGRRVFIDLTDQACDAAVRWATVVRDKGGLLVPRP